MKCDVFLNSLTKKPKTMKKTNLFTCALVLAALAISAQTTEKKQAKVHIKKVENINGVETVVDTTYLTDDPNMIISGDKVITEDVSNENGMVTKTIVIDDHDEKGEPTIKVHTGDPKQDAEIEKELREAHKKGGMKSKVIVMDENGKTTTKMIEGEDMEKALQEAHKALQEAHKEMQAAEKEKQMSEKDRQASEKAMQEAEKALQQAEKELLESHKNMKHQMIIIDENTNEDDKGDKQVTKIIMMRMDIRDANEEDVNRLKDQFGSVDNKVAIDNMRLYPNPNDGKFNLNFTLKNKGDVEVTVYDMQGKQVYNEKLSNFTGEYNKPIDISSNAKGIYFVKIQQGKHTQVKKISLD
jgi:hypothetical protein